MIFVLPLPRAGVDGMEQEINDWASELNFIQVSLEYLLYVDTL